MHAPPDPKKIAANRRRHEAEQRRQREVETCYRQYAPKQVFYREQMAT